jgi:DNA-binding MarR family transcriptional regulator
VGTIPNWSAATDWATVCRRASARRRRNSLRAFRAAQRRVQVVELLIELGGLQRGVQSEIAHRLGVHKSVISKDVKRLWGDGA